MLIVKFWKIRIERYYQLVKHCLTNWPTYSHYKKDKKEAAVRSTVFLYSVFFVITFAGETRSRRCPALSEDADVWKGKRVRIPCSPAAVCLLFWQWRRVVVMTLWAIGHCFLVLLKRKWEGARRKVKPEDLPLFAGRISTRARGKPWRSSPAALCAYFFC